MLMEVYELTCNCQIATRNVAKQRTSSIYKNLTPRVQSPVSIDSYAVILRQVTARAQRHRAADHYAERAAHTKYMRAARRRRTI